MLAALISWRLGFILPTPHANGVPPSRCLRCGAATREPICPSCVDYLVANRPLWLDPALLPGASLLDAVGPREVALVSSGLDRLEWRTKERESTDRDATRLVAFLRMDGSARPVLSAGDADVLHSFLGRARRGLVSDASAKSALSSLYRYLAAREWMPPHLAAEYRLRARALAPPEQREESGPKAHAAEALTPTGGVSSIEAEAPGVPDAPMPAPSPDVTDEPEPEPEGPLPAPQVAPKHVAPALVREEVPVPSTGSKPSFPPVESAERIALQAARLELDAERVRMEAWVHDRTDDFASKERVLAEREKVLAAKAQEIEAQERAATDRLVGLEKDAARREVLRFLGSVLGMTEEAADVIATAFPDLKSLEAADVQALGQCRGVSSALARAIRYALVPGEVEGEQRSIELRSEAIAFMEEGDFEGAHEIMSSLLRANPQDASLLFDKAELLILLDRPEEALACYTRVLDLDRKNRQAWFERANLMFGMGRLADALDSLREGLRVDPSKSGDLIHKAEELRRDARANDAVVLLQAVLDVDPANERAMLAYGDALLDLGDVEAAEGFFTRVLGKDPQNAGILFRKGQLLEKKGRWGAAVQFYNRAIALRWDNVEAWEAKGRALVGHGRPEEALECFDRVLSFDVDREDAWAGKAEAHMAMRQWEAGAKALEGLGALDTTHPSYLRLRERLARREIKEPESSGEPALDAAFAGIEEELGPAAPKAELPREFKSFVESVDAVRDDVGAILQLAELALEGGDASMALVRYEEAIGKEPRNADAWTGKGVALQRLERYEDALAAYDEALRQRPGHPIATRWRETCVRRLGRGKAP